MPSECGNETDPRTSIWLPRPTPHITLLKSPKPSIEMTAASSNGDAKKALARCARDALRNARGGFAVARLPRRRAPDRRAQRERYSPPGS